MSIKRKIIITYAIILIVVPIFVAGGIIGFFNYKYSSEEYLKFEEAEKAQLETENRMEIIANLFEKTASENPDYLRNEEFLKYIRFSFSNPFYGVRIIEGDEVLYESASYGSITKKEDIYTIEKKFVYTNGIEGKYVLVEREYDTSFWEREIIKDVRITFAIAIIFYLLFHMGFIYYVLKKVLRPLQKMKFAAENIRDGNLDYNISYSAKDEVGEVFSAFEEMRIQLKNTEDMKKQYEQNRKELISNISHDLRTPITAIKGYVEGIMDGVANNEEKLKRYIKTIYSNAVHMDTLIEDLFLFSKLDVQKEVFEFEEVDIEMYLDYCIEDISFDLNEKGINLNYRNEYKSKNKILADRDKLKRVITNIVGNSQKHLNKENKKIEIRLFEDKSFAYISIKDNGIGIDQDRLNFIFDRFYRVDGARNRKVGGSGLGLSIARSIIEEHGGEIYAKSEVGIYTEIIFSLKKSGEDKDGDKKDTDNRRRIKYSGIGKRLSRNKWL